MIYLIFKSINPYTRIGVSNQKDELEKSTLAKFVNNLEDLLDDISSNYSIIIDKVKHREYSIRHIFRNLLPGPNSNFNHFIERYRYDCDTVI